MNKLSVLLLIGLGFQSTSEAAGNQDEIKRIQKCYALFVQKRILKTDPLYEAVKSSKMTGTAACMELLSKADLDKNSGIIKDTTIKTTDPENVATRILTTFNDFHRLQFQKSEYSHPSPAEASLYDKNEPAYQFTYSIFKEDEKYKNVVTRDHHIRAIRYSKNTPAITVNALTHDGFKAKFLFQGKKTTMDGPDQGQVWNPVPVLVQQGILIGLKKDTEKNEVSAVTDLVATALRPDQKNKPISTNPHLGGGVLGSQSYTQANIPDKASHFRLWSKAVVSDFLCKNIPVLRESDVENEVKKDSDFAWRKAQNCMQCHETIDPLQATIRNHYEVPIYTETGVNHASFWVDRLVATYGDGNDLQGLPKFKTDDNLKTPRHYPEVSFNHANGDFIKIKGKATDAYSLRPPLGKLKFRSYNGKLKLIEIEVTGLQKLGEAMATTNDFYACAAKRYYYFLTGIDTNLDDDGADDFKITASEKKYRDRVIQLGLELKNHQSVKKMIENIIQSETFIHPDKGL